MMQATAGRGRPRESPRPPRRDRTATGGLLPDPAGAGASTAGSQLGCAWRRGTELLARWQAALGAVTTFREAARLLDELAGVQVGSETLRTQAERIGTELEGQQRAVMDSVEATHEPPAAEHDPAAGVLVVETDGVMV